jgi:uncharacterized protein YndB with AHSA1/START domain
MVEATVRRTVTVPVPVEHAFAVFADGMGSWWPRENTFARVFGKADAFETVVVEPKEGGRWFERTTDGVEADWGRVRVWDPPRRLVLTWQITPEGLPEPDSSKASEVEVRFVDEGLATTRVELEHREFARHGEDGGAIWRAGMDSTEGWTKFLDRYVAAVA